MNNELFITIVDPKEVIQEYKEQIIAIVENIDNYKDLEIIQAVVLNILLDGKEGAF